ncbi:MAG TPA: MerR family transcriptional regulator [Acidiferrobacterales bacterium]|nr:MerR family transcriptional regulator [Acidiferrobacterales bacterium]
MSRDLPDFSGLRISVVERDTGLSKDTLRVWERRYGFPQPTRDNTGERMYPQVQVEKLRLIKRLLDQGYRPSKIMGSSAAELSQLLEQQPPPNARSTAAKLSLEHLIALIKLHRSDELRAALAQAIMKEGLQRFVIERVAPLNEEIGEAWMRGEIQVHEEHLYTEQMQNALRSAINAHPAGGDRPKVLLTTFPEEEHGLGLLMAEAILATEGAHCVSIGTRTPLTHIRLAAIAGHFDVIALSFSAAFSTRQAVAGLQALRQATPDNIAIWAGGTGIHRKARLLPGVRVIGAIAETVSALDDWRANLRCTDIR